jgi:hypothetical protein
MTRVVHHLALTDLQRVHIKRAVSCEYGGSSCTNLRFSNFKISSADWLCSHVLGADVARFPTSDCFRRGPLPTTATDAMDGSDGAGLSSSDEESIVVTSCTFAPGILDRSPHAEADCPSRKRLPSRAAEACEYCYCFVCDATVAECVDRIAHRPNANCYGIRDDEERAENTTARERIEAGILKGESISTRRKEIRCLSSGVAGLAVRVKNAEQRVGVLSKCKPACPPAVEDTRSVLERLCDIENALAAMEKRLSVLEEVGVPRGAPLMDHVVESRHIPPNVDE